MRDFRKKSENERGAINVALAALLAISTLVLPAVVSLVRERQQIVSRANNPPTCGGLSGTHCNCDNCHTYTCVAPEQWRDDGLCGSACSAHPCCTQQKNICGQGGGGGVDCSGVYRPVGGEWCDGGVLKTSSGANAPQQTWCAPLSACSGPTLEVVASSSPCCNGEALCKCKGGAASPPSVPPVTPVPPGEKGCPGGSGKIVPVGSLSPGPCGGNFGNSCQRGTTCMCVCGDDGFWHVAEASKQSGFDSCCGVTSTATKPTLTPTPTGTPRPTPTSAPTPTGTPTPTPTGTPRPTPTPTLTPTPTPTLKPTPTPTPTSTPMPTPTSPPPPPPTPAAECENGARRCDGKVLLQCSKGQWSSIGYCDYGCNDPDGENGKDGFCSEPPPLFTWTGEYCLPGDRICKMFTIPPECRPCIKCARPWPFGFAVCLDSVSLIQGNGQANSPADNATLTFIAPNGKIYKTKTDEKGDFEIILPSQPYEVKIEKEGYKTLSFKWEPKMGIEYLLNFKLTKKQQEEKNYFEIKENAGQSLLEGWNLISLDRKPKDGFKASDLIKEINKQGGTAVSVSRWQNGGWETYLEGLDKNDFLIEVGKAYFVESLTSSKFSIEGEEITQPVALNLSPGWNAVGFPKVEKCGQGCSAQYILNLSGGQVISRFSSGLWSSLVADEGEFFGENFVITKGRGYFLKVKQKAELLP